MCREGQQGKPASVKAESPVKSSYQHIKHLRRDRPPLQSLECIHLILLVCVFVMQMAKAAICKGQGYVVHFPIFCAHCTESTTKCILYPYPFNLLFPLNRKPFRFAQQNAGAIWGEGL